MNSLAILMLATPLFGFSLDIDPSVMPPAAMQALVAQSSATQSGVSAAAGPRLGGSSSWSPSGGSLAVTPALFLQEAAEAGSAEDEAGMTRDQIREQLRQRGELAKIHRIMGISTWAAMTLTLASGYIQYHNLYGGFGGVEDTPCVQGTAVFGQDACSRVPLPHLITSVVTAGLYTATFGLSLGMSDPTGRMDQGDGDFARNLRMHKILRWIHLVGMVAQMGLGIVIANSDRLGIDRANDFDTLRALSSLHMAIGTVTWGALTWAGILYLDY